MCHFAICFWNEWPAGSSEEPITSSAYDFNRSLHTTLPTHFVYQSFPTMANGVYSPRSSWSCQTWHQVEHGSQRQSTRTKKIIIMQHISKALQSQISSRTWIYYCLLKVRQLMQIRLSASTILDSFNS